MQSRWARLSLNVGLLTLANLCWGSQYTIYKLIDGVGPITVTFLQLLIATPLLISLYLAERWSRQGACPEVPRELRCLWQWKNLLPFLAVGVLAAAGAVFIAWGMQHTTASNGALLSLTLPIMTALLAVVILRERMTAARWFGLGVALAGVLFLSVKPSEAATQGGLAIDWHTLGLMNGEYVLGNVLLLAAYTMSCLYNITCKSLLARFSAVEVLAYGLGLGLAASAASAAWLEWDSLSVLAGCSAKTWIGVVLLGVVAMALPQLLWTLVLERLDVSLVSVSLYLMPFFGVLLAAVLLHEPITLAMVIGGGITLAGTIFLVSRENANPASEAKP